MAEFTAGILALHLEVRIDVAELRTWEPSRIKALFAGIAQVIEAKEGRKAAEEKMRVLEAQHG